VPARCLGRRWKTANSETLPAKTLLTESLLTKSLAVESLAPEKIGIIIIALAWPHFPELPSDPKGFMPLALVICSIFAFRLACLAMERQSKLIRI